MFCNYEFIEPNADSLFKKLKKENYLKDASKEEIPLRLAHYLSEIKGVVNTKKQPFICQKWIDLTDQLTLCVLCTLCTLCGPVYVFC